jgi:hypothetical protein
METEIKFAELKTQPDDEGAVISDAAWPFHPEDRGGT